MSSTDLVAQSILARCLDNQSMPKIISMSEDLRAMREARNTRLYPTGTPYGPWSFNHERGRNSSNEMACRSANFSDKKE